MTILHQIWVGPYEAPLDWMSTWRDSNPQLEYVLWGEKDLRSFGLHNSKLFEHCLAQGIYDGASDVARVELLYRFGGIYIDADSVCLRPLEQRFQRAPFWAVEEPLSASFLVANGFMGAAKTRHNLLRRYISALSHLTPAFVKSSNCCIQTGPGLLTKLLAFKDGDEVIYPPWEFLTRTLDGAPIFGSPEGFVPFADHFYSSTNEKSIGMATRPYPGESRSSVSAGGLKVI